MTDPTAGIGLVLDCSDPERLAEFWAPALGYVNLGTAGSYVLLPPDGKPAQGCSSRSPRPRPSRTHAPRHRDRRHEAEATRLEASGSDGSVTTRSTSHGSTWILANDPEGNEFCVCDGGAPVTGG